MEHVKVLSTSSCFSYFYFIFFFALHMPLASNLVVLRLFVRLFFLNQIFVVEFFIVLPIVACAALFCCNSCSWISHCNVLKSKTHIELITFFTTTISSTKSKEVCKVFPKTFRHFKWKVKWDVAQCRRLHTFYTTFISNFHNF